MNNHRKNQRRHLVALAQVKDLECGTVLGYIEDLSTSGLMLLTDRAFIPGSTKRVSISFRNPQQGQMNINATLRIAWQQLIWNSNQETRAQYKMGCQIVAIVDADHIALWQAGSAYGLVSG